MPYHFLICPDSFKGSITAIEAAEAMARGILSGLPDSKVMILPVADGGEGTVDVILNNTPGKKIQVEVTGPLGKPVVATYAIIEDGTVAVIEMAAAAGLTLVPENRRNPLKTTTFGVGQLIQDALNKGCRKLLIGAGGSATNDLGTGLAQALGVEFQDRHGENITRHMCGDLLSEISDFNPGTCDPRLQETEMVILADVRNPLLGPSGTAAVYAPQKGAGPSDIRILEAGAEHFISLLEQKTSRKIKHIPGIGAAGGLAVMLMGLWQARIESGIDRILDICRFDSLLSHSDVVITGEGKFDEQSFNGKAVGNIVQRTVVSGKRVLVVAGQTQNLSGIIQNDLILACSLSEYAGSKAAAIAEPEKWLASACRHYSGTLTENTISD